MNKKVFEKSITVRLPEELINLLDRVCLSVGEGRSKIVRKALHEYIANHAKEINDAFRNKLLCLKSFEKAPVEDAKIKSICALYGMTEEDAAAFVKADAFVERLGIDPDDYVIRERWWLIACKYFQNDPEIRKSIDDEEGLCVSRRRPTHEKVRKEDGLGYFRKTSLGPEDGYCCDRCGYVSSDRREFISVYHGLYGEKTDLCLRCLREVVGKT